MARDSDVDSLSRYGSELSLSAAAYMDSSMLDDDDDDKLDFEEPSQSSLRRKLPFSCGICFFVPVTHCFARCCCHWSAVQHCVAVGATVALILMRG